MGEVKWIFVFQKFFPMSMSFLSFPSNQFGLADGERVEKLALRCRLTQSRWVNGCSVDCCGPLCVDSCSLMAGFDIISRSIAIYEICPQNIDVKLTLKGFLSFFIDVIKMKN